MRINPAKLRVAYGIFLGALTVIVSLLFLVEAAEIYYGAKPGAEIYTRAIVWAHLKYPLILTGFWALAVIFGLVFSVLLPAAPSKRKPADARATLSRLLARIPAGEGEEFLAARKKLRKWNIARLVIWCCVAAFCAVAAAISCVFLFDAAHYTGRELREIDADMLAMLRNVLPWLMASFALCIGAVVFECVSAKRILPTVKQLLVLGKGCPVEEPNTVKQGLDAACAVVGSKYGILVIRLVLLALGVILLVLGILNGGAEGVLHKAAMICKECIGLG